VDWLGLFLRLDGRIGRKAFWVGFAALIAGFFVTDLLTRGASIALILAIALIYPLVAVLVKRLHDRGRSGWWVAALAAPVAVAVVVASAGRLVGLGEESITRVATSAIWAGVLVLATLVVLELGLRPGDPGYSEHGPPPLD